MADLIDVLALRPAIEAAGIETKDFNFEAFYDEIATSDEQPVLRIQVEERVYEYFSDWQLPAQPTIYDYLVLSLREKDLIATFNWDPFLVQAWQRNTVVKRLPKAVFLHGNVGVGMCGKDKVYGLINNICQQCERPLIPSRLLYPVKHKDYNADPFIRSQWEVLKQYLNEAYYLTIFGYSAPKTDVEARSLMLGVWKENSTLDLAEIDIVDIRAKEELGKNWKEFFVREHYGIMNDIFRSWLMRYPRRSCDSFAGATLLLEPWYANPFPQFDTLTELQEWVMPLVEEEQQYEEKRQQFSGQPLPPNKAI
jgi:hypothetical protein